MLKRDIVPEIAVYLPDGFLWRRFLYFFNSQRCFIWMPYYAETVTAPETAIGEKGKKKRKKEMKYSLHTRIDSACLWKRIRTVAKHLCRVFCARNNVAPKEPTFCGII